MELGKRRFAHTRVCALVSLLALMGSQFSACSDDDLDFTQKENARCKDCEECANIAGSCLCETCISWAADPDTNSLLFCEDGFWRKKASCPGGASVGCTDGGHAHWTKCLDENGNEID